MILLILVVVLPQWRWLPLLVLTVAGIGLLAAM